MSVQDPPAQGHREFNFTAASTLNHLVVVGAACVVLWSIIAVTIGV